jgi:hypothetical protein
MKDPVTIRASTDDDRAAILRLAALDSQAAPVADSLLAFAGTELRAALPLNDGAPLADPFHPTAEIVDLLRVRARQMKPARRDRLVLGRRAVRLRAA